MSETKKKEEYPISPMHKHLKQVVWYQLAREPTPSGRNDNTGTLHRMKWLFRQEDFPCGACSRTSTIKFMVLPTGVHRSCEWEGFTERIEPVDVGEMHLEAILLEDIVCTNEQAIEVVKMYHQEKIYVGDNPIFFPQYKLPSHAGKILKEKSAEK